MKKRYLCNLKSNLLVFVLFSLVCLGNGAAAKQAKVVPGAGIDNLQVEYTDKPLGIDVAIPRFSWQMKAPAGARGYTQLSYQLEVKDGEGKPVWNSGKVNSGKSSGIEYAGKKLKAATRYTWKVMVWNQTGAMLANASWFETGLMNPDPNLSAWDGATWIGGDDRDLVLYARYLPIFNMNYRLAIAAGSARAAIILGANDARLMDRNKNMFQVENKKDQSYFKVELDISAVNSNGTGNAKINVYRSGYTGNDTATRVIKSFEIKASVINDGNKNKEHKFAIHNEFGTLTFNVDGDDAFFVDNNKAAADNQPAFVPRGPRKAVITLNPLGEGHDVISYGLLCDIGYAMDAGQQASFSGLEVSNARKPGNTLFKEDLSQNYAGIYKSFVGQAKSGISVKNDRFLVSGGSDGVFVVADPNHNSMPMLRTQFETGNKKIASARLYVTARGIYEVYLNGRRISNDYYNPGLTQYNITHFYQTYDVTTMVASGQNAMGAMLGEGWWSGLLSYGSIWNHFGDRQSLLAKLVIKYSDGSKKVITTNNKDWKYYNNGPIVYSSLDMGEVYNALLEAGISNWSTVNYNDQAWQKAVKVSLDGTTYSGISYDFLGRKEEFNYDKLSLIGQIGQPAGIYQTLTAKSMQEVRKGVYVYNMGQNIVGVPKIYIKNGRAGKKIALRYAEVLYPALKESGKNVGMIMTENYRAALSQDIYTMKDGQQTFQPHFTSHGYQYVEITGIDEPLPLSAVQGLAMSSIHKLTAGYATSNPKVNKLWSNLTWSNIDNFLTIPTDCPQRNERMGWSGDISIFSRTATYLSNSDQFLRRHLFALRDLQMASGKFTDIAPVGGGFGGVLWGSAGITIPWEAYQQYEDVALLKEHYPAMAKYMSFLDSTINKKTGLSSDSQLGDWLGPQNNQQGTDYLVTAYHIFDLGIMVKVATALNKPEDAAKYQERYDERKAFFNKTFVSADKKALGLLGGGIFAPPGAKEEFIVADIQTPYAVGLSLGVFNDENIPYMAKNLQGAVERENKDDGGIIRPKYSLMTGFIGTAWISKSLSDYGHADLAYKVLQNTHYPSWLYAIDQGATTIWERLNGYTVENGFGGNNSMNSFNHYSFGAVGQWMMAYSLGIQRGEVGFKNFILQPEPDPTGQMTYAKGYYDSPYGRINSSWKTAGNTLTYTATVPANTRAVLYLPAPSASAVTESGKAVAQVKGIKFLRYADGKAVYELASGSYAFSVGK